MIYFLAFLCWWILCWVVMCVLLTRVADSVMVKDVLKMFFIWPLPVMLAFIVYTEAELEEFFDREIWRRK